MCGTELRAIASAKRRLAILVLRSGESGPQLAISQVSDGISHQRHHLDLYASEQEAEVQRLVIWAHGGWSGAILRAQTTWCWLIRTATRSASCGSSECLAVGAALRQQKGPPASQPGSSSASVYAMTVLPRPPSRLQPMIDCSTATRPSGSCRTLYAAPNTVKQAIVDAFPRSSAELRPEQQCGVCVALPLR